jgi:hypothetical protein
VHSAPVTGGPQKPACNPFATERCARGCTVPVHPLHSGSGRCVTVQDAVPVPGRHRLRYLCDTSEAPAAPHLSR